MGRHHSSSQRGRCTWGQRHDTRSCKEIYDGMHGLRQVGPGNRTSEQRFQWREFSCSRDETRRNKGWKWMEGAFMCFHIFHLSEKNGYEDRRHEPPGQLKCQARILPWRQPLCHPRRRAHLHHLLLGTRPLTHRAACPAASLSGTRCHSRRRCPSSLGPQNQSDRRKLDLYGTCLILFRDLLMHLQGCRSHPE